MLATIVAAVRPYTYIQWGTVANNHQNPPWVRQISFFEELY